jgi:hypothetical protein
MNALEPVKKLMIYPRSVATNATASVTVDTIEFEHIAVDVLSGVASSNITLLNIGFGTATNSFTNIVVGGTATSTSVDFVIAAADTDNGCIQSFSIDKAGLERYMRVQVENTAVATVVAALIQLYKAKQPIDTAAKMGVDVFVAVPPTS